MQVNVNLSIVIFQFHWGHHTLSDTGKKGFPFLYQYEPPPDGHDNGKSEFATVLTTTGFAGYVLLFTSGKEIQHKHATKT